MKYLQAPDSNYVAYVSDVAEAVQLKSKGYKEVDKPGARKEALKQEAKQEKAPVLPEKP